MSWRYITVWQTPWTFSYLQFILKEHFTRNALWFIKVSGKIEWSQEFDIEPDILSVTDYFLYNIACNALPQFPSKTKCNTFTCEINLEFIQQWVLLRRYRWLCIITIENALRKILFLSSFSFYFFSLKSSRAM